MRDTRTLLLVLLSFCIIGTWVYHLYDKHEYTLHPQVVYKTEPAPLQKTGDSGNANGRGLDSANSQDTSVQGRLEKIVALRNEIATMLMDTNITTKELNQAEEKIRTLQQSITSLHNQTDSLINEKKDGSESERSESIINKATVSQKQNPDTRPVPPARRKENAEPKKDRETAQPTTTDENTLKATEVTLKAISQLETGKTQATTQAKTTSYLAISFNLNNDNTSFRSTPVYLVVTDPQGAVIQDDLWEAGIIPTQKDGSIKYTRKINIEYSSGEPQKVGLSLSLPKFPSGNYRLLLYHNGERIGRTSLALD